MSLDFDKPLSKAEKKAMPGYTLGTIRQAILFISLPFGILEFALPIYGKAIGAGALQIGLFFSAFFLMTVLMRPIVGVGLDRYGRRLFFLAGLLSYALTMFVFTFSNQAWTIPDDLPTREIYRGNRESGIRFLAFYPDMGFASFTTGPAGRPFWT
jgi:MFS family permease